MTKEELEFNRREDEMSRAISLLKQRHAEMALGGGSKAIEKSRQKNKMTARQRIQYLLDENSSFMEMGSFAGWGMYAGYGGCPSGGTVGGIGKVNGRTCMIIANDQTVKAGAWFPISGKKNLRLQEIAMENHLPVIYKIGR